MQMKGILHRKIFGSKIIHDEFGEVFEADIFGIISEAHRRKEELFSDIYAPQERLEKMEASMAEFFDIFMEFAGKFRTKKEGVASQQSEST